MHFPLLCKTVKIYNVRTFVRFYYSKLILSRNVRKCNSDYSKNAAGFLFKQQFE